MSSARKHSRLQPSTTQSPRCDDALGALKLTPCSSYTAAFVLSVGSGAPQSLGLDSRRTLVYAAAPRRAAVGGCVRSTLELDTLYVTYTE